MLLGAVVVPCNAGEKDQILANLQLWASPQLSPFTTEAAEKPKLVFVFNNATGQEVADAIRADFGRLRLSRHFDEVETWFLDLTGPRDAYIRDHQVKVDKNGHLAGPNNQFFETMRLTRYLGRYIFLMEADVIPIRANWLGRLSEIVAGPEPFFVLGSHYRGVGHLASPLARHINGNAVYAVGDPAFQAFLESVWEPKLRALVEGRERAAAYDCALEILFSGMQSLDPDNEIWKIWKEHAHRFRYSSYIQNFGSPVDTQDPPTDLACRILKTDPDTFVIHSQAVAVASARAVQCGLFDPAHWYIAPIPAPPASEPAKLYGRRYWLFGPRKPLRT